MATMDELAERVERLLLRHQELQRTHALTVQQLAVVSAERDSLKSRLAAARLRVDALLERLPADESPTTLPATLPTSSAAPPGPAATASHTANVAGDIGRVDHNPP